MPIKKISCLALIIVAMSLSSCKSTASPTPEATSPPIPTETQKPKPKAILGCNPTLQSLTNIEFNDSLTVDDVDRLLKNELLRATRVVPVPSDKSWAYLYVTYMSPQVIEAIVIWKTIHENLSTEERNSLIAEFERRLQLSNTIPFLLLVRGPQNPQVELSLGKIDESLALINQRQETFYPSSEYTPGLSQRINMISGGIEGYVLFPRSTGEKCNPTVNLLNDHSFSIQLSGITITGVEEGLINNTILTYTNQSATWTYTLLPSIPLAEAINIPIPDRATEGIDQGILLDILGLSVSIFELILVLS